jgi:hypothetical protein
MVTDGTVSAHSSSHFRNLVRISAGPQRIYPPTRQENICRGTDAKRTVHEATPSSAIIEITMNCDQYRIKCAHGAWHSVGFGVHERE